MQHSDTQAPYAAAAAMAPEGGLDATAAAGERTHVRWGRPAMSKIGGMPNHALVCATCCGVDALWSSEEFSARRDAAGRLLCENCGRQLAKIKHHRACGSGRACHPRCKAQKRAADNEAAEVSAAAAAPQARKRRATSDPGEEQHPAAPACVKRHATTRRVTSPRSPAINQQRMTRRDAQVARLLEETHARRVAAAAAAKPAFDHSPRSDY